MLLYATYHALTDLASDECTTLIDVLLYVSPAHRLPTLLTGQWVVETVLLIVWLYIGITVRWHIHAGSIIKGKRLTVYE